jgi:hypothetical protein
MAGKGDIPITRPVARWTDPETSWEAAEAFTNERLSDIQWDVLQFYRLRHFATDEELEDYFKDKYHAQTTVSKRRTDLYHLGILYDTKVKVWNRNNRRMTLWGLRPEWWAIVQSLPSKKEKKKKKGKPEKPVVDDEDW